MTDNTAVPAREAATADPIAAEIVRNYLVRTCEEMKIVVTRSAYSTVIYEVLDYSCGIFTADGEIIAEQSGIPIFLANIGEVIRTSRDVIGYETLEPGDVIVSNDPYTGGSHLPDTTTIVPIFDGDELFGFSGFRAHLLDWGGHAPGGMFNTTTDIYQEGLTIPPVRLYKAGQPNEDVFRILEANNRVPKLNTGDLRALVSGSFVGTERVEELIQTYGGARLKELIADILDRGEAASRVALEEIPDGTYSAEVTLDGTGDDDHRIDGPYRLEVAITVDGSDMHADFTGTADQLQGSANVPYHATVAAARAAYKFFVAPDIPNNEGCFRPLKITIPEGSVLSAQKPAPTSNYPTALGALLEIFQRALADAVPDKVIAGTFGDICVVFFYGHDPKSGEQFICAEPEGGGYGASEDADGESGLICPLDGDTYNIPVEIAETKYPIHLTRYELIEDSGGPGRRRGGLGVVREYEVPSGQRVGTMFGFDRSIMPAWGLFGGMPGRPNEVLLNPGTETERKVGKLTDHWMDGNEVFSTRTGGGGGWGDPLEREPSLVAEDVRNGFVSIERAATDYGVVLDAEGTAVDDSETQTLRAKMRSAA